MAGNCELGAKCDVYVIYDIPRILTLSVTVNKYRSLPILISLSR